MVQIDALGFEKCGDLCEGRGPLIDGVLRRVVAVRRAVHDQLRVRDEQEVVHSRLECQLGCLARQGGKAGN